MHRWAAPRAGGRRWVAAGGVCVAPGPAELRARAQMSIAEFYIENGIDASDDGSFDAFMHEHASSGSSDGAWAYAGRKAAAAAGEGAAAEEETMLSMLWEEEKEQARNDCPQRSGEGYEAYRRRSIAVGEAAADRAHPTAPQAARPASKKRRTPPSAGGTTRQPPKEGSGIKASIASRQRPAAPGRGGVALPAPRRKPGVPDPEACWTVLRRDCGFEEEPRMVRGAAALSVVAALSGLTWPSEAGDAAESALLVSRCTVGMPCLTS